MQPSYIGEGAMSGLRQTYRGSRAHTSRGLQASFRTRYRTAQEHPRPRLRRGCGKGRHTGQSRGHTQQGPVPRQDGRGHHRRCGHRIVQIRHGIRMEVRCQDAGCVPHREALLQGIRGLRPRGRQVRQGEQEPHGTRCCRCRPGY